MWERGASHPQAIRQRRQYRTGVRTRCHGTQTSELQCRTCMEWNANIISAKIRILILSSTFHRSIEIAILKGDCFGHIGYMY